MTTYFTTASVWFEGDTAEEVGAYVGFGRSTQDASLNALRRVLHQLITDEQGVCIDLSSYTEAQLYAAADEVDARIELQVLGEV